MTYEQFREFVRKYGSGRARFKLRWFKLNVHTGVVYICEKRSGINGNDWVWIYDGYFPIYENKTFVGIGTLDGECYKSEHEPVYHGNSGVDDYYESEPEYYGSSGDDDSWHDDGYW
jgi:hypothetical protein